MNAIKGLHYFFEGFELITRPGLKRYVIIPALINIVFFTLMFVLAWHYMQELNIWVMHHIPHWLAFLSVLLWLVFFISFILFFVYTFIIIANIIAAPFNALLAEKVEFFLTGKTLASKGLFDFIKDIPTIIGRQLSIVFYYLLRTALILILFFIPVIQSLAPLLWFLFSAWFIAISYVDYVADNHHVTVNQMRAALAREPGLALVFGASVLVASMVPVLNFFTIPAAVAGATKLWIEQYEP
jgi:CysZ protein